MTENTDTTTPPAPTPVPAPRPPLRRSSSDRVIAGVSSGIADWLGIDPVIVRVVLVVLAVFGGSGVVLYGIGWLFIPEAGTSTSEADRFIAKGQRPGSGLRTALIVAAAVIGTIAVLNLLSSSNGLWLAGGGGSLLLLMAVGGLAYWLVNRGRNAPSTTAPAPTAGLLPSATVAADEATAAAVASAATATDQVPSELPTGFAYGGYGQYPGYVAPMPVVPLPRQPRSYLGLAILSLALVVMGVLASLSLGGVVSIPAVAVLASGMGVLGIGMLISSVAGRAKWLMWLAIPLLMTTAVVAVVPANLHLPRAATIGERTWVPVTATEAGTIRSLAIGDAVLDLTSLSLAPGTTTPITASVGIGQIVVTVPPGMRVQVRASSGLGGVQVDGLPRREGANVTVVGELAGIVPTDAPIVELNVQAGVGEVEVHRA